MIYAYFDNHEPVVYSNTPEMLDLLKSDPHVQCIRDIETDEALFYRPKTTYCLYLAHPNDCKICMDYIGDRCYRRFVHGQMEDVQIGLISIAYIHDLQKVEETVHALRALGCVGNIDLFEEVDDGYTIGELEVRTYPGV